MKTKTRSKPIPERKKISLNNLSKLSKESRTIMIVSTKNLPDRQFQDIKKKLRGKVQIKVPKKSILVMALNEIKDDSIKQLSENIEGNSAVLFSEMDAFELAVELNKNKVPAGAKAGQEAPMDIEIPAGPTDLVPGPAISELGSLGIQIQIEGGKIKIKEPKIIVKKGEKINENSAGIMNKLDIKPFTVGFEPLVAFDNQDKVVYLEIVVDTEKTINSLKDAFARALPFAVSVSYSTPETIKFILGKAAGHERALSNLSPSESEEKMEEQPVQENDQTKSEEAK